MPKIRALKPDFWTDDAVVELSPLARLLFMGLWTYACDNGHVEDKPRQIKMRILPADDVKVGDLLDELVASGRILRRDGWVAVLNFSKHQKIDRRYFSTCNRPGCDRSGANTPTSQPETRGGHGGDTSSPHPTHDEPTSGAPGGGDGVCDGDGDGDGDTARELTLAEAPRADVDRLCELLADRIEANGSNRPAITAKWRDAARLMLDRDNRTEEQVAGAIAWSQADEFWRSNVLSMPKLRDQYERLRLSAQRTGGSKQSRAQQDTDDMFARAMARAEAKDAAMRGEGA